MGIVVNNAIVLVDCINRFRLEGMTMDEAIINAGAVRMRPVLMTAVTTVLGLLPLALGLGDGAEMIQPVAIVCIGGLVYGTLTTLVIILVMYKLFAKKHMEKDKSRGSGDHRGMIMCRNTLPVWLRLYLCINKTLKSCVCDDIISNVKPA